MESFISVNGIHFGAVLISETVSGPWTEGKTANSDTLWPHLVLDR